MKDLNADYITISHLNRQHRHIYELFITHQKLLMHGQNRQAYDQLLQVKTFLKHHMAAENDYLIPLYEKYISPVPPGGAVEFFIHEHHKITRYLEKFCALNFDKDDKTPDLVSLFDDYYKFKHLLDHHHTREDTFLFRLLDRVLDDKIISEVLSHFRFENLSQ
jgi:hemerythrin-like domain-containing protein